MPEELPAEEWDIGQELVIINKPTIDLILKQDKPRDLFALYLFYYYTAKWQKTACIYATTPYCAKGLKWSQEGVRRTKKILIELDLIEERQGFQRPGKFGKKYIYVKFIWWNKNKDNLETSSRPNGFAQSGKTCTAGNHKTNALSTNSRNALSTNKRTITKVIDEISESEIQSNESSKELSAQQTKPKGRYEIYAIKLILLWNSFSHTTSHKTDYPLTKTCQQLVKDLVSLQKGAFCLSGKEFNHDWLKQKKIPQQWLKQAWTYMELRDAIINLSKYSAEGFWPSTKKYFKSLPSLIYNSRQHNTWLFAAMRTPPKRLKQVEDEAWVNPWPEAIKVLQGTKAFPPDYVLDPRRLADGFSQLKDFSDNLIPDPYNKSLHWFGTLERLLTEYGTWLYRQDWIDAKENIIGTKNKVFERFIAEQEKEIGVPIRSKT